MECHKDRDQISGWTEAKANGDRDTDRQTDQQTETDTGKYINRKR